MSQVKLELKLLILFDLSRVTESSCSIPRTNKKITSLVIGVNVCQRRYIVHDRIALVDKPTLD